MTIEIGSEYIGLRYTSMMNPWIDFTVITWKLNKEEMTQMIYDAMDEFWESDDECYGDVLRDYFPHETIIFQDTETDEEAEYEAILSKIEWVALY